MAIAIRTPRINNNDDFVKFSQIMAAPGTLVRAGDLVAEIETDKATFTIEAEREGYILAFTQKPGEMIPVGSVLLWMGSSPDEPAPQTETAMSPGAAKEPTLKALLLLSRFGLKIDEVPFTGERLEAADVVAYARAREARQPARPAAALAMPGAAGHTETLTPAERGMLQTVLWHRQEAAVGYVEISYDPEPWERVAAAYQQRYRLLTSPVLALMAYRLVQVVRQMPRLNATIVGQERYQYEAINLGFTVQTRSSLQLVTLEKADRMDAREFVDTLLALQLSAMKGKLLPSQTSGATVAFTSMARWQVTRHAPILPPYTSFMAAHSHAVNGAAALGASYDHRLLTGGDAAAALRLVSQPPEEKSL